MKNSVQIPLYQEQLTNYCASVGELHRCNNQICTVIRKQLEENYSGAQVIRVYR